MALAAQAGNGLFAVKPDVFEFVLCHRDFSLTLGFLSWSDVERTGNEAPGGEQVKRRIFCSVFESKVIRFRRMSAKKFTQLYVPFITL